MKPIFNFSCIVCVRGRSGFWLMFDILANLISYRNVRSHDSYFRRPTIIACLHDSRDYLFYTYSFWEVPFSMVNVYVCMRSCHTAFIASVNNNWTFLCVRSMQISSFYMFKWNWNSFFFCIFSLWTSEEWLLKWNMTLIFLEHVYSTAWNWILRRKLRKKFIK